MGYECQCQNGNQFKVLFKTSRLQLQEMTSGILRQKKNQILFKNRAIKEQPGWLRSIYPAIAGSALVTRARAPSEQSPPD